jgi:ferredoxin
MTRSLRIEVDHSVCVGNGTCLTIAPDVFEHNAYRQSEVKNPDGAPEEVVLRAATNCPVGAIRVSDAATGQQLFPR